MVYNIQAAVLRGKGRPLKIESLELEGPRDDDPKLIRLFRAGKFPFDRLVKFYDFSDINRAMADAKRGDTIKPVLRIGQV